MRPGECPFTQNPSECHMFMSNQTCLTDSDCSESSKCCDCGCVRRCTLVSQYEPGEPKGDATERNIYAVVLQDRTARELRLCSLTPLPLFRDVIGVGTVQSHELSEIN